MYHRVQIGKTGVSGKHLVLNHLQDRNTQTLGYSVFGTPPSHLQDLMDYAILYIEKRGAIQSIPLPLYRERVLNCLPALSLSSLYRKGVMDMNESLRGVFYIVRGGHRRDKEPRFFNEVSESYSWVGGYDPEDQTNQEWYMLMDNVLFMCQAASSDLNTVLATAERCITQYKTKERYVEVMKSLDAFRHQSRTQKRLEQEVYKHYGDYYRSELEEVEDRAYTTLRENTPVMKARKRFKPRVVVKVKETPKEEETPLVSPAPVRKKGARLVRKRLVTI